MPLTPCQRVVNGSRVYFGVNCDDESGCFENVAVLGCEPGDWGTDWDEVTVQDPNQVNDLGMQHWFEFEHYDGSVNGPGADYSLEGQCCGQVLELSVNDITLARRSEFNIYPLDAIPGTSDYTVNSRLLLDDPLNLQGTPAEGNWFEMAVLMTENAAGFNHYYSLQIIQPNPPTPIYDLQIFRRYTGNGNIPEVLATFPNYPLPLGEWFDLTWYVDRDPVNGSIETWINGSPLLSLSGIRTEDRPDFRVQPAKVYHAQSNTDPKSVRNSAVTLCDGRHPPTSV